MGSPGAILAQMKMQKMALQQQDRARKDASLQRGMAMLANIGMQFKQMKQEKQLLAQRGEQVKDLQGRALQNKKDFATWIDKTYPDEQKKARNEAVKELREKGVGGTSEANRNILGIPTRKTEEATAASAVLDTQMKELTIKEKKLTNQARLLQNQQQAFKQSGVGRVGTMLKEGFGAAVKGGMFKGREPTKLTGENKQIADLTEAERLKLPWAPEARAMQDLKKQGVEQGIAGTDEYRKKEEATFVAGIRKQLASTAISASSPLEILRAVSGLTSHMSTLSGQATAIALPALEGMTSPDREKAMLGYLFDIGKAMDASGREDAADAMLDAAKRMKGMFKTQRDALGRLRLGE